MVIGQNEKYVSPATSFSCQRQTCNDDVSRSFSLDTQRTITIKSKTLRATLQYEWIARGTLFFDHLSRNVVVLPTLWHGVVCQNLLPRPSGRMIIGQNKKYVSPATSFCCQRQTCSDDVSRSFGLDAKRTIIVKSKTLRATLQYEWIARGTLSFDQLSRNLAVLPTLWHGVVCHTYS